MKNINKIVVLIGIALLCNASYAQKGSWTVGLYSGIRKEIVAIESLTYDAKYDNLVDFGDFAIFRSIENYISKPPIELHIAYKVANNFSLSSGLVFIQHVKKLTRNSIVDYKGTDIKKVSSMFNALQIPLTVRYDVPIKTTGLSFFAKSGLSMDISIGRDKVSGSSSQFSPAIDFYELEEGVYKPYDLYFTVLEGSNANNKFNLLVNTGIGISYRLKSGIGFSLSGEYNVGFLRLQYLSFRSQIKEIDTDILRYEEVVRLISRNEYWNVLLGVTYTFKQKKKE